MKFTRSTGKPSKNHSSAGGLSGSAPSSKGPKTVYQIEPHMHVRFNADGWVEELGRGTEGLPTGTPLGGLASSKLDDIYARRFYDLYSRVIIFDIRPRRETDLTRATGTIAFRDLDPDSPMHQRVNKIIAIANEQFQMNIKPLA